ncbi:heparin lyase I family protein [Alteromonas mediterranea]|uniref:heparin lyase I family protein n=1 Tax=Alteromonas mediterranea TaxID=314275 RepID=UPI0015E8705C|nr:heparin lyase I family protein [Alteromonas mediterranea]
MSSNNKKETPLVEVLKVLFYFLLIALVISALSACGGGANEAAPPQSIPIPDPSGSDGAQEDAEFIVESEASLRATGSASPAQTYSLIESVFGEGSIEAPDLFTGDHVETAHIIEETDSTVGPHFVFLAHRDEDFNKGVQSDRQRNEIKTYDKSDSAVLGFEGETMQFEWYFYVSSDMSLSSKFSHFFQLKARNSSDSNENGNDDQPVITLSGVEKDSSGKELQVRHSVGFNTDGSRTSDVYLIKTNWGDITDEWVKIAVQATFAEEGSFSMQITRLEDNVTVVDINEPHIDMWRGVSGEDFIRPKWGIYRSVAELDKLRGQEERVKFADFVIRKGTP